MTKPRALCIYCGSSARGPESHRLAAEALGRLLAKNGIRIIYGGGHVGLMGIVADAALAEGGEVIGIIPKFLDELEVGHTGCTELVVTQSMHERKLKMTELADGFVILPGGLGTLDETFEVVTWKQLRLHDKPIVIVNVDGYWTPLIELIDQQIRNNYVRERDRSLFRVVDRVEGVLDTVAALPPEQVELETKWT